MRRPANTARASTRSWPSWARADAARRLAAAAALTAACGAAAAQEPSPGAAVVPSPAEALEAARGAEGAAQAPAPAAPQGDVPAPQAQGVPDAAAADAATGTAADGEAGAPADGPGDPAAPGPPETAQRPQPEAVRIVRDAVLSRAAAFADRSLALQNAVVRYCFLPSPAARRALDGAFEDAARHAGLLVPVAFGAPAARAAPERLLTDVADTAFSRSRLRAIVSGQAEAPRTLGALREAEAALQGLPALEAVMLSRFARDRDTLAERCALALTVAAAVRDTAVRMDRAWRGRQRAAHWVSDAPELAGRLRLRDIIQGMIIAVDRLNRETRQFLADPERNSELPFARPDTMVLYLDALAAGIAGQTELLRQLTSEEVLDQDGLLDGLAAALEDGRLALRMPAQERSATRISRAIGSAQAAIIQRLPELFGFDASAFQRPPTALEPAAAAAPAEEDDRATPR